MKSLIASTMMFAVCCCLNIAGANAQEVAPSPKAMAAEMSGEKQADAKPACCSKSAGEAASCCKEGVCEAGCPMAAALAKLPTMKYRVGDKEVCCADSAAKMAAASEASLEYLVDGEAYAEKAQAMKSLVEKTEAMVVSYTTPSVCSVSGKTTIAGETCSCPVTGAKNVELVKAAVEAVNVSYMIGDEPCSCSVKAGQMAAQGEEVKYVVDGQETCCEMTHRLNVARAKYRAAVKAMSDANASTDQQPAAEEVIAS